MQWNNSDADKKGEVMRVDGNLSMQKSSTRRPTRIGMNLRQKKDISSTKLAREKESPGQQRLRVMHRELLE